MIPCSAPLPNHEAWQRHLAEGFRSAKALLAHLGLERLWTPAMEAAARRFPLRVPRYYADLMTPGDPDDPLLRQVLPDSAELTSPPGYGTDPTGDSHALAGPGLLHKYPQRALVITTGGCAVHCRYCFRRHFDYTAAGARPARWDPVLDALAKTPDLEEVILSGGDPLLLDDDRLGILLEGLATLPGLRRLRIHSRLPVVLPQRIGERLVHLIASTGLPAVLVLHVNHPAELTEFLSCALSSLRRAGIALLNQAVLLRGVNDSLETQLELNKKLFESGILPYYLHQLDKVRGAAHFQVPDEHAKALHAAMQQRLPGYLVPKLVREIPGASCKRPL